jgi:hypothetical protein
MVAVKNHDLAAVLSAIPTSRQIIADAALELLDVDASRFKGFVFRVMASCPPNQLAIVEDNLRFISVVGNFGWPESATPAAGSTIGTARPPMIERFIKRVTRLYRKSLQKKKGRGRQVDFRI